MGPEKSTTSVLIVADLSTCRQEEYEKSAAGRAAKAQMKAMKESKTAGNQGEPVLKVPVAPTVPLSRLYCNFPLFRPCKNELLLSRVCLLNNLLTGAVADGFINFSCRDLCYSHVSIQNHVQVFHFNGMMRP